MSSIYFLKCLGFSDIYQRNDEQLNISDKRVSYQKEYKNCYWDDFACDMENLIGLKMNNNNSNSNKKNVMSLVLECVESLINLKMALSIDLLILCCIYANYCNNNQFFNVLQAAIIECLDGNDANYKTRNYQWFKYFILNSNVWLVKMPSEDEEKTEPQTTSYDTDDEDDTPDSTIILFDTIVVDVNKLLMKQKEYIWNNAQEIQNEKEMKLEFEKLCNFGVNSIANNNSDTGIKLRQDTIDNGIVADANEFELLLQKIEMGDSAHSNFDLKFENNTKTYLTQCLAFAHANNNTLQSEMKDYFGNKIGIKCKYASAPVKLANRCVVKATSDYGKKDYPSCAHILDFLRFSVTFNNVNDLLNGLNKFVTDINKGDVIECLLPNGLLRVKNGFNDILNKWKSVNDASYVDIKLNIIYINKNSKDKDVEPRSMIIEGQFLLSFLLKAKKIGHKYYSIVRQSELINNIKNQVYIIDNDYSKYKKKILKFAQTHDTGSLIKELFWKPHIVLSMIVGGGEYGGHYPLFVELCKRFAGVNSKFVLFFLNCLFYHSFVMLKEENNETNTLLKKYFNWGYSYYTMGDVRDGRDFYSIPIIAIVSSSVESSIVRLILEKEYLNVFGFYGAKHVCGIVCCFFLCVFVFAAFVVLQCV